MPSFKDDNIINIQQGELMSLKKYIIASAAILLSSNVFAAMDYEDRIYSYDCQGSGGGIVFKTDSAGNTIKYGAGVSQTIVRYQETSKKVKVGEDVWQYKFVSQNGDSSVWNWTSNGSRVQQMQAITNGKVIFSNGKMGPIDSPTLSECSASSPVYKLVSAYVNSAPK